LSLRFTQFRYSVLGLTVLLAPVAVAWTALAQEGEERLLPGLYPAAPGSAGPVEPYDSAFDVDWAVSLRGGFTHDAEGQRYDVVLVPRVGLERDKVGIGLEAELGLPVDGQAGRIERFGGDVEGSYAIDRDTEISLRGSVGYEQSDAAEPGIADAVAVPAGSARADFGVGIARQWGLFGAALDAGIERTVYGETQMRDGTLVPNGDRNLVALDAGLRVGYQVTPILEVFGEGEVGRDLFDHASPALGEKADATRYALRGGVAGSWNGILEAEVSAGTGLRQYEAEGLPDMRSTLFDAHVTFTPDSTVRLSAGLGSSVEPVGPDMPGYARIETSASADAEYNVNSWLRLRASAGWYTARFEGSEETETGHDLGVGADYKVNAHTQLSADYAFAHSARSSETPEDSHRMTVGVTVAR